MEAIREVAILAADTPAEDTRAVIQAETQGEVPGEAALIQAVVVEGPTGDVRTLKKIRKCSRLCAQGIR